VNELENEKRKETSQMETEIKKLEDEIAELNNKMKSKENNPLY